MMVINVDFRCQICHQPRLLNLLRFGFDPKREISSIDSVKQGMRIEHDMLDISVWSALTIQEAPVVTRLLPPELIRLLRRSWLRIWRLTSRHIACTGHCVESREYPKSNRHHKEECEDRCDDYLLGVLVLLSETRLHERLLLRILAAAPMLNLV